MNRKKFLLISAVVVTGAAVPVLIRLNHDSFYDKPLIHPWFLDHLFDNETIREIGTAYRSKIPAENTAQELTRLLLVNPAGILVQSSDDKAVRQLLEQKIHTDFETGSTIMVNGWILSSTEARQCALFSITEN